MATRLYCLDAPRDAVSSKFDLNCMAVTIKAADDPTLVVQQFDRGGRGEDIVNSFDGSSFASRVAKVIYNSSYVAQALENLHSQFPWFFSSSSFTSL
jgi:hypothetical protein